MYSPNFFTKPNGVPVVSKKWIDAVAENFIRDFKPEALVVPQAIDIDDFAFNYLGLNLDFHHLSHDESILGAMVFQESVVPVYNPEKNKAEYALVAEGTVVIDVGLSDSVNENRYRYTVGHEVGHAIFHEEYFRKEALMEGKSLHMSEEVQEAYGSSFKQIEKWSDMDFMEWQANYFSAAILMPKSMVEMVLRGISVRDSYFRDEEYVYAVTEAFQVSWEAASNRLNSLGIIINAARVKARKSVYLDFVVNG